MRRSPLLAGVALGAVAALALATPAQADHQPIHINDSHVPTTAAGFSTQECDGPFSDLPGGHRDGWHFQLGAGGDSFTSLTLTYSTPAGDVVAEVDSRDANDPSTGPGWSGYIGATGQSGKYTHGWVVTDAGWTLTAAEATVDVHGQQSRFQLSHTCAGTPKPTPSESVSPSPSESPEASPSTSPEVSPEPSKTPEVDVSTSPAAGAGGGLPVTGASVGVMVALGLGLLGGGASLMFLRKRRDLGDLTGH